MYFVFGLNERGSRSPRLYGNSSLNVSHEDLTSAGSFKREGEELGSPVPLAFAPAFNCHSTASRMPNKSSHILLLCSFALRTPSEPLQPAIQHRTPLLLHHHPHSLLHRLLQLSNPRYLLRPRSSRRRCDPSIIGVDRVGPERDVELVRSRFRADAVRVDAEHREFRRLPAAVVENDSEEGLRRFSISSAARKRGERNAQSRIALPSSSSPTVLQTRMIHLRRRRR